MVSGKDHLGGGEQLLAAYEALREWIMGAEALGEATWRNVVPLVRLGDRLLRELRVQVMYVLHGIRRADVFAEIAVQPDTLSLDVIQARLLARKKQRRPQSGRGGGSGNGSSNSRRQGNGRDARLGLRASQSPLTPRNSFNNNMYCDFAKGTPGAGRRPTKPASDRVPAHRWRSTRRLPLRAGITPKR